MYLGEVLLDSLFNIDDAVECNGELYADAETQFRISAAKEAMLELLEHLDDRDDPESEPSVESGKCLIEAIAPSLN